MRINNFEITEKCDIESAVSSIRGAGSVPAETVKAVQEIIDCVRDGGDRSLLEMIKRLDGAVLTPEQLEVTEKERSQAWEELDAGAKDALGKAEARIASFARNTLSVDWESEVDAGLTVRQVHRPLDSVGIYIPGGRFSYPSTVLMTGIPAREAGVGSIVFCTPPGEDGKINAATLAATRLVGGCRVFRAGGAQAVAAMAYGTESLPGCQMVAGPGNIYVTTAKRLVSGQVSIDLDAGPSELAVFLDGSVDLSFPAFDLLAQLEHDPLSVAVMISESAGVLKAAAGVISGLDVGATAGSGNGSVNLVLSATRELSLEFLNRLAPEHLEIMVEGAENIVDGLRSAGAVFVGPYSPAVMGDYLAGPSHVLPTGGAAARQSGLSAESFRRTINVIAYTEEGFLKDAGEARLLASMERLEKHALSVDIRMR